MHRVLVLDLEHPAVERARDAVLLRAPSRRRDGSRAQRVLRLRVHARARHPSRALRLLRGLSALIRARICASSMARWRISAMSGVDAAAASASTAVISPSGPFATRRYILPNCWTRTDDAQILRRRRRAPPRGSLLSLRARGRLLETRWPRAPHSGAARPPPSRGGSFVPRAPVTLSATSKSRKVKSVSRQLSPQPSKGPFAAEKLDAINFV